MVIVSLMLFVNMLEKMGLEYLWKVADHLNRQLKPFRGKISERSESTKNSVELILTTENKDN